ncbi:hypothetical protein PG984_005258 [Apiospora sp. TS-2023a]
MSSSTPTTAAGSASSSGPSSSNSPAPSSSSSITSGTVAGAAIGAFIGGLLIGLAIILLVCRGRRRKEKHGLSKRPPVETRKEVVRPEEDRSLIDKHPQTDLPSLDATPDGELAEAYRNIHKLLQQHMDNFYHRQPVDVDFATVKRAAERLELGPEDDLELNSLLSLALEPRTRTTALHHIIAQTLVRSIDFHSPGNLSMLPPHLVGLARSFPAGERGSGNSDGKHHTSFSPSSTACVLIHSPRKKAFEKSLHQWRALTAYLMQPHRSHRLPLVPSEETLNPQTEMVTLSLVDFLGPFVAVDEVSQTKQKSHLQAIAFECAKFGYLLLSQPREWQFLYHEQATASQGKGRGGGQHEVVLHPGLQKLGVQGGSNKRGGPQVVVAPMIAKI